jgi:hypothetical protein
MVSHTHGGTIPLAAADSLIREESLRRFCDTYDHLQPGITGRKLADTISDITDDVEKLIRCHLDRGVNHAAFVHIHFMTRCAICAPSEPHPLSWANTAPTEEEDEDDDEVRSVHSSDGQEDNSEEKTMSFEATNESGKRQKVQ